MGKWEIYHRGMWAFTTEKPWDFTISLSKIGIYTVINMVEELFNEDLAIVFLGVFTMKHLGCRGQNVCGANPHG